MNNQDPNIHTMPEKFMPGDGKQAPQQTSPKPSGKLKRFLPLIIIIILLVIIIGGVSFYLFFTLQDQQSDPVTIPVNENTNVVVVNENENTNENENVNTNENVNVNTNTNLNTNTNTNANLNLNLPTQIKESADSDKDLLTNKEEEVLDTDVNSPDTDSDGYIDGQELLAGYNPLGAGSLSEAESILTLYQNTAFPYEVLYPSVWNVDSLDQEQRTVLFTSDTGEFMEITVSDNPESQTPSKWYTELYPDVKAKNLTKVNTLDESLSGIKSLQGYTIYYSDDNYIYSITYNFGTKTEINFNNIFEMMYLNFAINPDFEPVTEEIDTNTNENTNTNTNLNQNTNYAL